jgi:hypothetical protein
MRQSPLQPFLPFEIALSPHPAKGMVSALLSMHSIPD